ncbi:MAG: hypothetical protein AM326_06635 [Candidatus Thorarchaeota archaeon SMTZ-45]|nr:MAG: hypothetical protein AM326_06635 [Candidatus Thorarchaeota archaeon SMTZ-45]
MSLVAARDHVRNNLLEFTRTAFSMIPPIDNPCILDIGCGTGVQTIELAKISNGKVTAIDIDAKALDILRHKAKDAGVSDRISIMELSMLKLNNLNEIYDIIWAEGSIFIVGFENGLRDWKRLLTRDGFLVVHDEDTDVDTKLQLIEKHGYQEIGLIEISHDEWWKKYYAPLGNLLGKMGINGDNEKSLKDEINMFRKTRMGSILFILQSKS